MPREISDQEYAYLQNRRQVADFVESIYQDPTLNKEAKALIKKKYPNLQIQDFDLEQKFEKRLDDEQKKREQREQAERQKQEDALYAQQRKDTQDRYGFTDDAMKKLEDLMVEKNIGNYDVAAQYMASKETKTSDAGYDETRWHHERQPGWADIAKDPEAWGRDEIMKSLRADQERAKNQRY